MPDFYSFYPSLFIGQQSSEAAGGTLRKVCRWQLVLTLRCPSGGLSLRQKGKGYLFLTLLRRV